MSSGTDAPIKFGNRIVDKGQLKNLGYLFLAQSKKVEKVVIQPIDLSEHLSLLPILPIPAQFSKDKTVELLIGFGKNELSHKILLLAKNGKSVRGLSRVMINNEA